MDLRGVGKGDGYGQLALNNILKELTTNWGKLLFKKKKRNAREGRDDRK